MTLPPVALTPGDPAGVGPEIAVKAWKSLRGDLPFFLIADTAAMGPVCRAGGIEAVPITDPAETLAVAGRGLPVLDHPFPAGITPGALQATNAAATISAIERAVGFVRSGAALALCTNPINKWALKKGADFPFPGHTEFLEHLAGTGDRAVMMLAAPELRVVPATIHIPLGEVLARLTAELLTSVIETTHASLQSDFAIPHPRIAVAGLNPHAGEGGTMGREELDLIGPMLDRLRRRGLDLTGPMSADTMFHAEARARYDVAICMYHDQALIPLKTLNFSAGVNVTLGLPFVRTSPDHGTALDIAGQGRADATSLVQALRMAHELGLNRRQGHGG